MSIRAAGMNVDESVTEEVSAKGKQKETNDHENKTDKNDKLECPGCFDDSPDYTKLSCGHAFWYGLFEKNPGLDANGYCTDTSNDCYKEYLSIKIKDGQADKISCPAYKCTLSVPEHVVKTLVDEDTFKKYNSFLANSYVENNPYVMWCPAPGRSGV